MIDVIIPTYCPDARFLLLLDRLKEQREPVRNVIVMNTARKRFTEKLPEIDFKERYPFVKLYHLSERDFDHGGTRREGIAKSDADYVLLMTQDAVPADETLTQELLQALTQNERVVAAYARQLPREGASPEEAFERSFNYPKTSRLQTRTDIKTLGFKAFYCSNVCAMYQKEAYDALGGFLERAIFNEDVYFAQKAVRKGYAIAYAAKAQVIHSHGYTCLEQLHRNFDQGVSQAMHPEMFEDVPQEKEGMRLVKACSAYLFQHGAAHRIPYFYVKCAFRLLGYRAGKHFRRLPKRACHALAMNKAFFER